jgi:hypothetical protein
VAHSIADMAELLKTRRIKSELYDETITGNISGISIFKF